MYRKAALVSALSAVAVRGQQVGTLTAENHPALSWERCTAENSCSTVAGQVVLDANWRYLHETSSGTNCYTGNTWDTSICSTDATCATACALDGADYQGTYGITASGNSLKLGFVTHGPFSTNIGSRNYLMADENTYEIFDLLNNEFTFDVDVSNLPCGLNGALYFVSMAANGQVGGSNAAGAKYGTGYCDSQCPRDLKFIAGQANVEGWEPSSTDVNAGTGNHGSCCAEMDIWEANSVSSAVTPHACSPVGQSTCTGDACGGGSVPSADRYAGVCDPDGCDFNSFRMGDTSFYGEGLTVDTSKPFTVVTQFLTENNELSEIKRFYVQDGKTIANSESQIPGVTGNSITPAFCDAQKAAFGDTTSFQDKGGFSSMSSAMAEGMVLVMSLWDDHAVDMLWLDSDYPTTSPVSQPGIARGTCSTSSGDPKTVESQSGSSSVTYSNIKFGPINSTFTPL